MKIKITSILILIIISLIGNVHAQSITGYIYDILSNEALPNVNIKNTRTNESVLTDRFGQFKIEGQINDFLSIHTVGYMQDTLFYYDDAVRRVYLTKDENVLHIDEVLVKRFTDNLLNIELAKAINNGKIFEVPKNKGGVKISPSRLLSQESKQVRNNIQILKEEQNARKIDQKFTKNLIRKLLPLDDSQIALFKERYRPTLDFIEKATEEDIRLYIFDSYKNFKKP